MSYIYAHNTLPGPAKEMVGPPHWPPWASPTPPAPIFHVFNFMSSIYNLVICFCAKISSFRTCNLVFVFYTNNKAGYTATSCGQVGRCGNALFYTFRLVLTDRRTDRRTDNGSYRVACPQLKKTLDYAVRQLVLLLPNRT